jgi:KDO2-lipid IV(A) lauroyltransferase
VHTQFTCSYTPHRFATLALEALARFPLWWLALWGSILGQIASVFDRRRRRIVRRNLEACFPELPPADIRRLMCHHFRVLWRSALCGIAIAWWHSEERLRRCVHVRGLHHFYDARRHRRPVILMAPHFVNLDIGWLRAVLDRPMMCMYREPRPHMFHWAAHRHRLRFGGVAIERGAHLKQLIRLLRGGDSFYYLPDVDPGKRTAHVFAPFFGVPAATVTGLSRIAHMAHAVVIMCVTRERGWGRYEIEFQAPMKNFPSNDCIKDTMRMNSLIEHEVRKSPEQYLWVHRRFKTRPRGAPGFYD